MAIFLRNRYLDRRTLLRGAGVAVGLPWLSAMAPARARAGGAAAVTPPRRMLFVYVPNGINMVDWTPADTGRAYRLPFILEPLADVRDEFSVLTGLNHHEASPGADGGGDHARASATFLTGARARKTAASNIRCGVSVDQVAARKIGLFTRFPSLELTCARGQLAGSCDSGYSCAYQFCMSWKSPVTPIPPESSPRQAFDRLFSTPDVADADDLRRRRHADRSVLDFVLADMHGLRARVGADDRGKLDEYADAVREVEAQIQRTERFATPPARYPASSSIPGSYEQYIRTMMDIVVLALRADATRIATLQIAQDGSNRTYSFIGIPEGHHDLSHHLGDAEKKAKIARINRFHTTQLAYFLRRLRDSREARGTLLDASMVVYGSGISDGNRHNHDDLPILLAGRGGGTLVPGRHVRYDGDPPMTNLYLSLLDRMDASVDSLGDSTGRLPNLDATA